MKVIVVGSGIAGLFTALKSAEEHEIVLVTKAALHESNTRYAQGGIAAVVDQNDSVQDHIDDTLRAGAGLCNAEAVDVLCSEGPQRVRELIELGVEFDRVGDQLARGLEGAHTHARVLHAGGDATGAYIEAALVDALDARNVRVIEHAVLQDLIVDKGRVTGVHLLCSDGPVREMADAVVLATGGAGRIYSHTTNPRVATGDGFAAAFRAGAMVRDAEMYQFHPTLLALPGEPFLVSEAVRGEGAVLRNASGRAFMDDEHVLGNLAPRDVVARAIASQMALHNGDCVVLDATHLDREFLRLRFPSIDRACTSRGIDWAETAVPVTPAAHYWMGGVTTDLDGRTSLPGLFAVGEVASNGVHGANRLASNSLLEGIVFGARVAGALAIAEQSWFDSSTIEVRELEHRSAGNVVCSADDVAGVMWDHVGLVRDADGLQIARKQLDEFVGGDARTTNMLTVARVVTAGALAREESRGAHFRSDFTGTSTPRHIGWVSKGGSRHGL